MPIYYVGKTTNYAGKRLFDLLCKLKNFGVGRTVYRNTFQRYPQPSYYVITKVDPYMADPSQRLPEAQKNPRSKATGIRVFRGKDIGEREIKNGWKADWRLVPKTEEEVFKTMTVPPPEPNVVSDTAPLPPLMEYMLKQQAKLSGTPLKEPMYLQLRIKQQICNNVSVKQSTTS